MKKPSIGILAGMGPRSTGPFIDMVVTECQRQYGARDDIDFPKMMICSQPAPFYEDRPVDHAALEEAIREGLLDLERTGVDFLAIACNTAHIYYPQLARSVKVPLLNMVEIALEALPGDTRKLALVAARPTVESEVYQAGIRARGLPLFEPEWQSEVDHLLGMTRTSATALRSVPIFYGTLRDSAGPWKALRGVRFFDNAPVDQDQARGLTGAGATVLDLG